MDEMKNIVKNIIKTAQECKNNGNYDTAFNLADIAKNLIDEMAVVPVTGEILARN